MKDLHYVFIGGIFGDPQNPDEWMDKAIAYIQLNCPGCHATTLPYETGAVFRRIGQEERVDNLETILKRVNGHRFVLVAHSNGGDIVERLIKRKNFFFEEVHLIASASENNFKKNGFNKAIKTGIVKNMFIHWSKKDKALQKAKWSSYLFSWLGLGYGYLGLTGPKNIDKEIRHRATPIEYKLDHSEYFNAKNFEPLMKKITGK